MGGRFKTPPPSRLEARSRLGVKAANELGAPAVSSIPAQLPGPEPASARKGREDDRAVLRWNRRVAGPARPVAGCRRARASRSPTTKQVGACSSSASGPTAARIAEIVTMRRQLCDEHVAIQNQAAQLEDAMLRRLAKRRLARIEADIRLLEKRLTETIGR